MFTGRRVPVLHHQPTTRHTIKRLLLPVILSLVTTSASAYVFGDTNFGIGGYPEFDEMKPSEPFNRDRYSFDQYRDEVERYREAARTYIENANNDIERIREEQQKAIDAANQAVRDFNDWAERRY